AVRLVKDLAADALIGEARLLAECGSEDDSRFITCHGEDLAHDGIHALVAVTDGVPVGPLLRLGRLELEARWLEGAAVDVLEMRRTVDEEGGEGRPQLAVVMSEHVELQSVENGGAPPRGAAEALR